MVRMTALEMVSLYEDLKRKSGQKWYKIHRQGKLMQKHKDTFKRLREVLEYKKIPIREYMTVQFKNKGWRPWPHQMTGDAAFARWDEFKRSEDGKAEYHMQERYLAQYLKQDYSLEEALALPQFRYWFRCMMLKPHPKIWEFYANKELVTSPGLRDLIERGYFGKTI